MLSKYPILDDLRKRGFRSGLTFENVNLELKGGINSTNQTVMEYDGKYPEGSKFGNTNAYGFFIRHTDQVEFINCNITSELPDAREWLVQQNVNKVTIN